MCLYVGDLSVFGRAMFGGFCMYFRLQVLVSFVCRIHMCLGVMHVSGDPCVLGTCGFSGALHVFRESPYPPFVHMRNGLSPCPLIPLPGSASL